MNFQSSAENSRGTPLRNSPLPPEPYARRNRSPRPPQERYPGRPEDKTRKRRGGAEDLPAATKAQPFPSSHFRKSSTRDRLTTISNSGRGRAVERCRVRSGGLDPDVLLNAIRSPREYKQRYVVRFNDRIVPVQTTDIAYFY